MVFGLIEDCMQGIPFRLGVYTECACSSSLNGKTYTIGVVPIILNKTKYDCEYSDVQV